MVEVTNVSAYMASWVADAAKQPTIVPRSIAAREARKIQLLQERDGVTDGDIESTAPIMQATTAGLDLMNEGYHQPRSTLSHALGAYAENE